MDHIGERTIGVLIPTYNRFEYLKLALESILTQSYSNIEIIVIDNGSMDSSKEFIKTRQDARLRYIVNEQNLGLIGSIRKGMQLFSDKVSWCTILPDDDLLDRDFVASMVDYVNRHPEAAVVHGHRLLIDEAGKRIGETSIPPECETAIEYLVSRSRFIRQTFLAGVFFARSAYEKIGGYPQFTTGMASDDALIFGLALKPGLFFNRESIALVRMHPEAESHRSSNVRKHIQAFEDFRDYIIRISAADDQLSSRDRTMLRRALDTYVRKSISGLWIHRVHDLLIGKLPFPEQELSELYSLVGKRNLPFSLRVRIDACFATYFNWSPELNPRYRLYWENRHRKKSKLSRE